MIVEPKAKFEIFILTASVEYGGFAKICGTQPKIEKVDFANSLWYFFILAKLHN